MYKITRRRFGLGLTAIAVALSMSRAHAAIEIVTGENAGLEIFGTGQLLGLGEYANDTIKKNARAYLFMQQARLGFSGHLGDYNFYTELALGGENMTPSGGGNPAFTMLEMRFDAPTSEHSFLRVGQFKTPYGAEFLTPDYERDFAELSIANLGTNWGREIGLAFVSKSDFFNLAVGAFTGGGENTPALPIHALPEDFGSPLMAARLGIDTTGGDALTHKPSNLAQVDGTQTALYLQGAYEIDSLIGHSSAMAIKAGQAGSVYQQNLLLNTAWNPYMTLINKSTLYSFGINGLLRTRQGNSVIAGEFETSLSGFSSVLGSLTMYTARIQGSATLKPWNFAIRLAALAPDANMGPRSSPGAIGGVPFYEITPAVTYYLKDWSKLILEFQSLVNVPVAHEPGDGAYVLADMPSQTTYTSGTTTLPDPITRDFVPEVKIMWQITL